MVAVQFALCACERSALDTANNEKEVLVVCYGGLGMCSLKY